MNNGALRKNDKLIGSHEYKKLIGSDENGNDLYELVSVTINGYINDGSNNVLINNEPAVRLNDATYETDLACNGYGNVITGSGSVFINGLPAARQKDTIKTHKGNGEFITSSNNVVIGD